MKSILSKMILLDLDGTLLDDQKQISQMNRSAIDRALHEGHKVVISTGRPLSSAKKQAAKLGLTTEGCYCIAYNGAVLYDTFRDRILYEQTLPLSTVYDLYERAKAFGVHIQTYLGPNVAVEACHVDPELQSYCKAIDIDYTTLQTIYALKEAPVKMLSIDLDASSKLDQFRAKIKELYPDTIDAYYSNPYYLEIVPAGMNKGNALMQLADKLNIPIEATIAAGDAPNDIPMIRTAGIGVAMKNASEDVKAAADYVTQNDNNHSAIAELFEKFVLSSSII